MHANSQAPNEGPIYLSWDCGSKNLAYVMFRMNTNAGGGGNGENGGERTNGGSEGNGDGHDDHADHSDGACVDEITILNWEILDLQETVMPRIVKSLHNELSLRPHLAKADVVCVEQQLPIHTQMFAFQFALYMYFLCQQKTKFEFIPARCKFNVISLSEEDEARYVTAKEKYAQRKQRATGMATNYLAAMKDARPLTYLLQHNKADDLADCLLQGIYCARRQAQKKVQSRRIFELVSELEDDNRKQASEKATVQERGGPGEAYSAECGPNS